MDSTANRRATPGIFAAKYLDARLSVIPIRADGSKAPACGSWNRFQSELATPQALHQLFPADNLGVAIIHGAVSGNSECIDVDNEELFGPYCAEVNRVMPGLIGRLTVIQTPHWLSLDLSLR